MVPSVAVLLDALPLNPNGKIDRKALPEPEFVSNNEYAAPEGEVEIQLALIWCKVLGLEQVGRHDNFFELGGDSISAVQAHSKIKQHYSINIPLRLLFEGTSLSELCQLIEPEVSKACDTLSNELDKMDELLAELEF
jgi:acyl carrier protein